MTRNQKAKTILNAIDKYAPTCIDWNLEAMWLDAIARGLIDIEKEEFQKQNPEKGMSFVDYMFWQYGSLEEVLKVHDNIQDSLDELKENTDEDQIAVRVNIADYTARLRRWYRQYEEYCEVSRTDNSLAEAMESVLKWRNRRNNEVSG